MQLNGLRKNFSDVAFWEPRLYTDRKGTADFTVKFPDNLTRWDAVVYAMNRRLKTGTARRSVKSYKPIMAELKTPRFLTVGDSSYLSTAIRNYSKDTHIEGIARFVLNSDTVKQESISMDNVYSANPLITASMTDSLTAAYTFTRTDGYMDGEERTIPIVPQGVIMHQGTLGFLDNGDSIRLTAENNEALHVKITGQPLNIYLDVVNYLRGYRYDCNEQLASKLIGLLSYRLYSQFYSERFIHDKNVKDIIRRLSGNLNSTGLWSWWGLSSSASHWVSAHVMQALQLAKESGYEVKLPQLTDTVKITYRELAPYQTVTLSDLDVFHTLVRNGLYPVCRECVEMFEKMVRNREQEEKNIAIAKKREGIKYIPYSYLKEKLQLWEIMQLQGLGNITDSISRYLQKTTTGAIYCDDDLRKSYWYSDNLLNTLTSYRIIRRDSMKRHLMMPMQMFVLSTRAMGWNTRQAASAVATIMPDLIAANKQEAESKVLLTGKENRTLIKFPFETILSPGESLNISKQSGIPLIYTSYADRRITKATSGETFEVRSYLNSATLTAGKPCTLTVIVNVKQAGAEYVMIEVPIPASCSYASKSNYFYRDYEVHREYFSEKTVIFCEQLPKGEHKFEIQLLPRFTGAYILNPAKVEMMYLPVVNANNDLRKVKVE
jgi:uncharacterized protein YfaS (alpha-2-macroglobulin family)